MNADILVIGGGAVGFATARELLLRGASVTLVERGRTGQEASWAGGGILFPLLPWDYPEFVNALALAGIRAYPALIEQLRVEAGLDPELRTSGMLVLPPMDEPAALAWGDRHGLAVERTEARRRAPALAEEAQALWLPEVLQVRNPRYLAAFRAWLAGRGVTFLEECPVEGLRLQGDRVAGVVTSRGELRADRVIIAAGAWSASLLAPLGGTPDVRPIRGQMLLYQGPTDRLGPVVMKNGTYIVPRADGRVLVGSTLEDVGFDKGTTEAARRALHETATTLLPFLADAPLERHWAGLRPGSPGNRPTIARHPAVENLYLNGGHFRYGVTMAPASAALLADLIEGCPPALDPTPYRWPGT